MIAIDRLFRLVPDGTLMRGERLYGAALERFANHRLGFAVVETAHGLFAKVVGAIVKVRAVGGGRPPSVVAAQTMEKFFLPILEPHPSSGDAYTFEFVKCPYGLEAGTSELCHAIMNLEEEIVRTLGGELVIASRIAEGAPACRFTVRNTLPKWS